MTPELDAGRILGQRVVEVRQSASIFEATAILFGEGAEILDGVLHRLDGPGIEPHGDASYQSWPTPKEIRALRRLGVRLIRLAALRHLFRARRAPRKVLGE
jgi:hypothetical protein